MALYKWITNNYLQCIQPENFKRIIINKRLSFVYVNIHFSFIGKSEILKWYNCYFIYDSDPVLQI